MNEETKGISVPYILYEGEMARAERRQKRNFLLILILVGALLLSNFGWLYAWMQYDYVEEGEQLVIEGGERGNASYIGRDGDINNGENNNYEAEENADEK